jgi:hypothetical protein
VLCTSNAPRNRRSIPVSATVGAWRSLVAHTLGVRVVAGSNPAAPTNSKPKRFKAFLRILVQNRIALRPRLWGLLWGPCLKIDDCRFARALQRRDSVPARLRPDMGVA